jgi:protease I
MNEKRNIFLLLILAIVLGCSGNKEVSGTMANLQGKNVLMVIAANNFRDEELLEPKAALERNGAKVVIASSSLSTARGMLGATVKPDVLIGDKKVDDYDAVVFVGGTGASEYWDDTMAHEIAREAFSQGKVTAAICIAPVTLAKAGILDGKKATVWASEGTQIKNAGAEYTGAGVEVDGNIITADGPASAAAFGDALVKSLAK